MTVMYNASELGFIGTVTMWKGTMLPLVLNSGIFWGLVVLHTSLMITADYLTEKYDYMLPAIEYSEAGTVMSLLTFFTLWSVAMPLVSFGLNAFTRQLEYQADAYSVRLGFDIRKALAKISKTNLSDLNPDPLDSLFHHSHPTTVQRVLAVKQLLDTCERKAL